MKKLLIILLVSSLFFSSCRLGNDGQDIDKSKGKESKENLDDKDKDKTGGESDTASLGEYDGVKLNWDFEDGGIFKSQEFKRSEYSPVHKEFTFKEDLSDLENIDRFKGFTDEQKRILAKQGFLVMDQNEDDWLNYKLYNVYETNEYNDIPNFVTVDNAVHLFHSFFDNTLKQIESESLDEELKMLTKLMTDRAFALYTEEKDPAIREQLAIITEYFGVANFILNGEELEDQALMDVVREEVGKIEASDAITTNFYTGHKVNYKQFKVRGHYKGDEKLEKYFKGMMWYGLFGLPIFEKQELVFDNLAKSLNIAYILFSDESGELQKAWKKIYDTTSIFAGKSDDLNIYDLKNLMEEVYGEKIDYHAFYDRAFEEALTDEAKKFAKPRIVGKVSYTDVNTDIQYRFMGQRFTIDARILQELMEAEVRPVPTVLDVANVFGSKTAEEIVKEDYLYVMPYDEYKKRADMLKVEYEEYHLDENVSNMYEGWLWCLDALYNFENTEERSKYPTFMQGKEYIYKLLSTASANYAELKHDTILYGKQPMAEMGGPELQYSFPGYVEPLVEVYDRLLWLTDYAKAVIEHYSLLSQEDRIMSGLERASDIYKFLRDISIKELENKELTEEEIMEIAWIGGAFEHATDSFLNYQSYGKAPSLIADISQVLDTGESLEVGTGFPDDIYVVLSYKDKKYLAKGSVYSFYEFLSPTPLADDEWHRMMGIVQEDEYGTNVVEPENFKRELPDQPKWISKFKFMGKNRVSVEALSW